jgi:hypothetical protein
MVSRSLEQDHFEFVARTMAERSKEPRGAWADAKKDGEVALFIFIRVVPE